MNERIKDLAEQAGYAPLEPRAFADDLQEVFLQKFAELIVKECVNCCDEVDKLNKAFIKCYDFDPQHGPKECIQQILEHFGVEE